MVWPLKLFSKKMGAEAVSREPAISTSLAVIVKLLLLEKRRQSRLILNVPSPVPSQSAEKVIGLRPGSPTLVTESCNWIP